MTSDGMASARTNPTPRVWTRRRALGAGLGLAAGLALASRAGLAQATPTAFDADVGIDPGHSRADVGTSGFGVGEYQHTLDVALRLKPLLEEAGLTVNLTRTDHTPLTAMSHSDIIERTRIEQAARIAAVGHVRVYR